MGQYRVRKEDLLRILHSVQSTGFRDLAGTDITATVPMSERLVNELVAEEAHLDRALEIAEGLAAFPQPTMLSDRRAAIEGAGLPLADGLALEAELGRASVETGLRGAARFAAGEGRGAQGAGV